LCITILITARVGVVALRGTVARVATDAGKGLALILVVSNLVRRAIWAITKSTHLTDVGYVFGDDVGGA
jgi:hypothetical protein